MPDDNMMFDDAHCPHCKAHLVHGVCAGLARELAHVRARLRAVTERYRPPPVVPVAGPAFEGDDAP